MSGAYVYTPTERASRRLGLFLLVLIGVALTVILFSVKTQAQAASEEVARLEAEIERQKVAITVLSAERAVLTNPERLREIASGALDLAPIKTDATVTFETIESGEVGP